MADRVASDARMVEDWTLMLRLRLETVRRHGSVSIGRLEVRIAQGVIHTACFESSNLLVENFGLVLW
jgi:hypothetical protein